MQREVETLQKLEMYKESERLVQALQSKLENHQDGDELREYLKGKLGYQASPYAEYISSSLDKQCDLNDHLKEQALISQGASPTSNDVKDSINTGNPSDTYVPSNELDHV